MTKKVIPLLLFPIFCTGQIQNDKQQHFMTGVFISGMVYSATYIETQNRKKAFTSALITATVAGIAKEVLDSREPGNHFDINDAVDTSLGGFAVCGTIKLFEQKKPHRFRRGL